MMRVAGMAEDAIARFADITEASVASTLSSTRVQKYLLALQSTFIDDLRPLAVRMNEIITGNAERAARVVAEIMEEMHQRPEPRAKSVALASAVDILDRAGYRPTQRVEQANIHAVHPDSIQQIADVLRELGSSGTVGSSPPSGPSPNGTASDR